MVRARLIGVLVCLQVVFISHSWVQAAAGLGGKTIVEATTGIPRPPCPVPRISKPCPNSGYQYDSNNCSTGYCSNPCLEDPEYCAPGRLCQVAPGNYSNCTVPNCPAPTVQCVQRNRCSPLDCSRSPPCISGYLRDSDGICPTSCDCADPCKENRSMCGNGTVCQLVKVKNGKGNGCEKPPCRGNEVQCVAVRCPKRRDPCTLNCSLGYTKDDKGCDVCKCYSPCDDAANRCDRGESCKFIRQPCPNNVCPTPKTTCVKQVCPPANQPCPANGVQCSVDSDCDTGLMCCAGNNNCQVCRTPILGRR